MPEPEKTEPDMSEIDVSAEGNDTPPGFMRRTVAPAVAIMILYASIRAFPSILVSQTPPINGEHLLVVFLISLVVFYLFGLYNDRKRQHKGPNP